MEWMVMGNDSGMNTKLPTGSDHLGMHDRKIHWRKMVLRTIGGFVLILFTTVYVQYHALSAFAQNYQIIITDHGFAPDRITGEMNQPVHISIINKGTRVHNFILPAFYIYTANLPPKHSTSVGFSPDKKGVYSFFSDTGGSKEPGLSGHIKVN